MSDKSAFQWEGHKRKPRLYDRFIIYVIWFLTLTVIIGLGVVINRKFTNSDKQIIATRIISSPQKVEKKEPVFTTEPTEHEKKQSQEQTSIPEEVNDQKKNIIYALRMKRKYISFREANKKALDFERMNFRTQIVPTGDSYYIELEDFAEKEEAFSLQKTLSKSNLVCEIVEKSSLGLNPQKNIEEELTRLNEISQIEEQGPQLQKTDEIGLTVSVGEAETIPETQPELVNKAKETVQKVLSVEKDEPVKEKEIAVKDEPESAPETIIKERTIATEIDAVKPAAETYSLQAGAYKVLDGAEKLQKHLHNSHGQPAFILRKQGLYKVFFGTFESYENARKFFESTSLIVFEGHPVNFFITRIN